MQTISTDTTINVPANYATIQAAISSLNDTWITPNASVTIQVATGRYSVSGGIQINHPCAGRIKIAGTNTITQSVSNVSSVTGSPYGYSVTYIVADTSAIQTGDLITIENTSGVSIAHALHRGAWKVTAVTASSITARNTCQMQPLSGAITTTLRIYPTQIMFSGAGNGYYVNALGGMTQLAIQGDGTDATFGLICRSLDVQQGSANIGPNLAVSNFGAEGIRANYHGTVNANSVYSSSNGNNGFMARDSGALVVINCVSSGNGFLQAPGGGNGFLSQCNSSMLVYSCASHGNFGDGFYGRTSSHLHCENGSPSFATHNANGFRAGANGSLQANSCASYNNANNGFYTDSGILIATNADAKNNGGNGYMAQDDGVMTAPGSASAGSAYNGFSAIQGGRIDASSTNVISCTLTPYIAVDDGWILRFSPIGLSTCSPPLNTRGNNNAYIKG